MSGFSTDAPTFVTAGGGETVGLLDGELGRRLDDGRFDWTTDAMIGLSDVNSTSVVVSAGYRHILPADVLDAADTAVNCHISYLPYCRGANPNVWSIIEDVPAGVTIHEMVESVDAGPIIAQRRVGIDPSDTGRDLYERLLDAMVALFEETWPAIEAGTYDTRPNPTGDGTYHVTNEFEELCALDLSERATVGETIDRLRALTFPPHDNAYFERGGDRYYVEVDITEGERG